MASGDLGGEGGGENPGMRPLVGPPPVGEERPDDVKGSSGANLVADIDIWRLTGVFVSSLSLTSSPAPALAMDLSDPAGDADL